ncbi:MAG: N-acetylmuramoyl-L-alanine amidase [Pseudomonadales bacterium]|nr:N-acetylmuramoyl-L-alanine amidase [Pseudomonadales bacterium]
MNGNSMQKRVLSLVLFVFVSLTADLSFGAELNGVRLWRAPDHTRVVFDLTDINSYKVFSLSNPLRLVVDIDNTRLKTDFSQLNLSNTPIQKIRHSGGEKGKMRLVFDLQQPVKPNSFILKANNEHSNRLVFDLYDRNKRKVVIKTATRVQQQRRDVVVVIDAGHGGEDSGAVGYRKLLEKDVVLDISKRLYRLLDKEKGFRPEYTRKGDYYIGLRKRSEMARDKQADLLVSIHADSFKNRKAHGASVFTLSSNGATSESARWLASRENSADLVGGVELENKNWSLKKTLISLSMNASIDASQQAADQVLESIGTLSDLHKSGIEQAGFMVLKSDVPSMLIETGFISNRKEASNLGKPAYRQKMAQKIFDGLKQYFEQSPPDGTYLAWQKWKTPTVTEHVIIRGETLSEIAYRYRISLEVLKKVNRLNGSSIHVGQKLRIPVS